MKSTLMTVSRGKKRNTCKNDQKIRTSYRNIAEGKKTSKNKLITGVHINIHILTSLLDFQIQTNAIRRGGGNTYLLLKSQVYVCFDG